VFRGSFFIGCLIDTACAPNKRIAVFLGIQVGNLLRASSIVRAGAAIAVASWDLGAGDNGHGDAIQNRGALAPAVAIAPVAIGFAMVIGGGGRGGLATAEATGRVFDAEDDRIRRGDVGAGRIDDEPARAISEYLRRAGGIGGGKVPIGVAEGIGDGREAIREKRIGGRGLGHCGRGEGREGD
jgi:hypothetical protein